MKTLASFTASLLLVLSACKGDKAASTPAEPAVKPVEVAAKPAEPTPAPAAPAPMEAVKPAAPAARPADGLPDLQGLKVGSSLDAVEALMDKDENWWSQRDCDSCLDGDYLYGDVDSPRLTVTVKNGKVAKITEHPIAPN